MAKSLESLGAVALIACGGVPAFAADHQDAGHIRVFPAFVNVYQPATAAAAPHAPPADKFAPEVILSSGTNFAYRGVTLNGAHGYVLGGVDASYAATPALTVAGGVWSEIDYDHGALHRPVYAYWANAAGQTSFGHFTTSVFYLDVPADEDLFTVEFGVDGKRKVFRALSFTWGLAASPGALSPYGDMAYVTSGFVIDPTPALFGIGVSGHAARQWAEDHVAFGTPDYNEYELAVTKSLHGFDARLAATTTDIAHKDCFDGAHDCEGRVTFTLSHAIGL